MKNITQLICEKNKISYIVFDTKFTIVEFNETMTHVVDDKSKLAVGSFIYDVMWEFIGLEDRMLELLHAEASSKKESIHFPMIMKENTYYDLDIETFTSESQGNLFIAYIIQKTQDSLSYINMIKEMNKRTLVYETQEKEYNKEHQTLINKKLLSFNVDMDGFISSVNNAFTYFFDIGKDTIIGKHFSHFFQARDLNLNDNSTIIFNAINKNEEVISFHADIIPITEDGTVYENIIVCQDITYLKQIEKKLEYAAGHDTLTDLPNRSKLFQKIDTLIDKQSIFTLCFIDVDNFKPINDTYGHHAGDMLLKHIAKVLQDFIRKSDVVARIGGDEFIIVFDSLSKEKFKKTTLKRLSLLAQKNPLIYTKEDIIDFSISVGVSSYPEDATGAQELIKIADTIMYKNKKDKERRR